MASNVMSWLSEKRKKSTEVETAQLWLCYRRSTMMAQQVYSYAAVVQAEPPEHFPWWHEAGEFVRPRRYFSTSSSTSIPPWLREI